jgi:PST family polysaccharide transporter
MVCWAVFRLIFILFATAWIPSLPKLRTNIKPYLNYGFNLAAFNLVNFFVRNFDSILIGKLFGATILGFYTRAYRLILTPSLEINLPLTQAILPSLSRVQNDPARFRSIYIKFLSIVSSITIPLIIFICISSKDLFFILLGPGWDRSAEFILLLIPLAYVNATNFSDGIVYQGMGTTNRQLKWYLFMAPLIILSMWIGSFWGANGVAISTSLSLFIIRPFSLYYCYKETTITFRDFLSASIRTSIISVTSAVITIFIFNKIEIPLILLEISTYINFAIKGSIYLFMWVILEFYIGGSPKLFTLLAEYKNKLKKDQN